MTLGIIAAGIAVFTGIGAGIGIEHLVESQHPQRGHHLAGDRSSDRHVEVFAERDSYCRSCLRYDML